MKKLQVPIYGLSRFLRKKQNLEKFIVKAAGRWPPLLGTTGSFTFLKKKFQNMDK